MLLLLLGKTIDVDEAFAAVNARVLLTIAAASPLLRAESCEIFNFVILQALALVRSNSLTSSLYVQIFKITGNKVPNLRYSGRY